MLIQINPEARPMVRDLFGLDIIIQTFSKMLISAKFPKKLDEEKKVISEKYK